MNWLSKLLGVSGRSPSLSEEWSAMGVVRNREDRHFLDSLSSIERAALRQRSVAIQDAGYQPVRNFIKADGLGWVNSGDFLSMLPGCLVRMMPAPYFWLGAEAEGLR